MAGLYIDTENPISGAMEKKCLPAIPHKVRQEGLALSLPFNRRPVDHRFPETRIETLPIPLKGVTFDPVRIHKDSQVLGQGAGSVAEWLATLVLAGFTVHDSASSARTVQQQDNAQRVIDAINSAPALKGVELKTAHISDLLSKRPRGANAVFDTETLCRVVGNYLKLPADNAVVVAVASGLQERATDWSSRSNDSIPLTSELRAEALLEALDYPVSVASLLDAFDVKLPDDEDLKALKTCSIAWRPHAIKGLSEDAILARMRLPEGRLELAISISASLDEDIKNTSSGITSSGPQFNGLNWLLNPKKGMHLLAYGNVSALSHYFGIPEPILHEIQSQTRVLLKAYSGDMGALHELRNQIGGSISSFAELYLPRIAELEQEVQHLKAQFQVITLPPVLAEKDSDRAFWGTGFDGETLLQRWQGCACGLSEVLDSLAALRGQAPNKLKPSTLDDTERKLDHIRLLFGNLRLVINNLRGWDKDIDAARAHGNTTTAHELSVKRQRIKLDPRLFVLLDTLPLESEAIDENGVDGSDAEASAVRPVQLKRLVRQRSLRMDIKDRVRRIAQSLPHALALNDAHIAALLGGRSLASHLLRAYAEQDRRHYANRGIVVTEDHLNVQARRHFLNEWFTLWRNLSRPAADYAQQQMNALALGSKAAGGKKALRWRQVTHRFMQERKGVLWKGIFARSKHKPYELDQAALMALDCDALVARMSDWLAQQYTQSTYSAVTVVYIAVQARLLEIASRTADKVLPADAWALDAWPLEVYLREGERDLIERGAMNVRLQSRIASRLATSLRDAASLVYRETHSDSATFKVEKVLKELVYVCKTRTANDEPRYWTPPERLWRSTAPVGEILNELAAEWRDGDGAIPVNTLFTQLSDLLCTGSLAPERAQAARQLLSEMPHTWAIRDALKGLKSDDSPFSPDQCLRIGKTDVDRVSRTNGVIPMMLTPDWSNRLDECLTGARTHIPGNLTLRYRYRKSQDYTPEAVRVEVHIPTSKVAAPVESPEDSPYFDHLIGIDLGERGIGFSVRNVRDPNFPLIERGTVPIPAVRQLIKATRRYRSRHQKNLAVRKSHVDFSQMREAVAGNVLSAIKYLMYHYKGLPVLEQDLSGINKGNKQLSHVYTEVLNTLLYQEVKTADAVRANTWRGNYITHPWLKRVIKSEDKGRSIEVKDFNLFPGTGVRAYGTSQTCSGCGVNPVELLRKAPAQVVLNDQGVLTCEGVELQFFTPASINRVTRGEGNPEPLSGNRQMKRDELLSHLKNVQLRIRPQSRQSKDTSQSRYWCANKACQHHAPEGILHADMNAADNIVLRKLASLVPIGPED